MKNGKYIFIYFLLIIILLFQPGKNNTNIDNLINKYYLSSFSNEYIDIKLENFVFGNINNNTAMYYKLNVLHDTEQIFFDYQSDYGCLYINIENIFESNYSDFKFCSEGINNIFILNKNDILGDVSKNNGNSIKDLIIYIKIEFSDLEMDKNLDFDYSLKVSLRKPIINILEINSEHKILCKSEKFTVNNYRCIFMIVNTEQNNEENNTNLIIYSNTKNNIKLNIYADYINKSEYDNWNIEYLNNTVPNNNSVYNNSYTENEFIIIQNLESEKYIYLSIELNTEATIEILSQYISYQDLINLTNINNFKVYSFDNNSNYKSLDFNNLSLNEIYLSLVTLYGKASIYFENDKVTEYISDIRENRILLNINLDLCKINNNCKLKINKLEEDFIFYIYYTIQTEKTLKELEYGKSNKIFYNIPPSPIILYEQIPDINSPININLQIYNIPKIEPKDLDIEVLLFSQKELYNTKLNQSYINNYNNKIKSKFDSVLLASNIYLTIEDLESFKVENNFYLIISISKLNNLSINLEDELIIGSTISQKNSLIYPSERIYHFGKLYYEEKVIYRLKGNKKYHLMRLEFGCNSNYIDWSVKRTDDDSGNYRNNDTDLSFVTEKWINGRGLFTLYIEKGEDIYLTIYINKIVDNYNLTNYIFKYINSEKNGDFNNYIIKSDSLNYDKEKKQITINKLNNYPSYSFANYYLKIIPKNNYISKESLNTISLIESKDNLTLKGENKNKILFNLNNIITKNNTYYINAYCAINERYSDIEYISYKELIINEKFRYKKPSNKKLLLTSLIIGGIAFLMILFNCLKTCCCYSLCRSRRRYSFDDDFPFDFNDTLEINNDLLIDIDDELY